MKTLDDLLGFVIMIIPVNKRYFLGENNQLVEDVSQAKLYKNQFKVKQEAKKHINSWIKKCWKSDFGRFVDIFGGDGTWPQVGDMVRIVKTNETGIVFAHRFATNPLEDEIKSLFPWEVLFTEQYTAGPHGSYRRRTCTFSELELEPYDFSKLSASNFSNYLKNCTNP